MPARPHSHLALSRRGMTTPIVAIALVVAMLGTALVLDRLWLELARVELLSAAEGSALAAARELARDDLLVQDDPQDSASEQSSAETRRLVPQTADPQVESSESPRLTRARLAAQQVAALNRATGQPVELRTTPAGLSDVQFGRLKQDDGGRVVFEPDTVDPTSVLVIAARRRSRNNPVGLFMGQLTGVAYGDVVAQAEATVDNQIVGVRPLPGAPVPALPLAIWKRDPSGMIPQTWESAIEQRRGSDNYQFDAGAQEVSEGSDGIPELTLTFPAKNSNDRPNAAMVGIGHEFDEATLLAQWQRGWSTDDLPDGEIFGPSEQQPIDVAALTSLSGSDREELRQQLGQPRIVPLYSAMVPAGRGGSSNDRHGKQTCTLVGLVAIRVMHVEEPQRGRCQVVVQPTVITTRTAVLAPEAMRESQLAEGTSTETNDEASPANDSRPTRAETAPPTLANRYIYRLQVTY